MARRQMQLWAGALVALLLVVGGVAARRTHGPAARATGTPSARAETRQPEAPARPPEAIVAAGPPRMLHLDRRHTNRSPYEGPGVPSLAFAFEAEGPIEAAPALLDDGTIVVATLGGKLFGVGPDGKARWSVDLADRAYSSPLVVPDEGIYVGSDAGKLFGLRPNGSVRFRLETDSDADTAPTLSPWGGVVFASGKIVYAAIPNGTLLWRFKTRRKVYSSPAVSDDGTVFVGSQDNHLYAIGPDGKLRFRVDLGADVDSSPAIGDDGTVFAGTDRGEVLAIDPRDGSIKWRASVGGYVRGALSVARSGDVLLGTYGPTPRMLSLDPRSGAIRFAFSVPGTGAPEFGIHGGPVEDALGRLYFGAQDDFIYALSPTGQLLWKYRTTGDVDAPLVIGPDGRLLAGSDDGKLYVFERLPRG